MLLRLLGMLRSGVPRRNTQFLEKGCLFLLNQRMATEKVHLKVSNVPFAVLLENLRCLMFMATEFL